MPETDLGVVIGVMLLIRIGQTLLLAGCVRSKNAAAVAVRCVLDFALVALAVWAVGGLFVPFSLDGDTRPWLAWGQLLGNGAGLATTSMMLPALLLLTGATLGATAERARQTPPLVFAGVMAAVVLPVLFRFGLWFYGPRPHPDLGGVIATIGGGAAALVFAHAVGPRKGKFNRDLSTNFVPGHAVAFQLVGLLLLAAGWGVTTRNGLHAQLGLAAALVAGAAYGRVRFGKPDVGLLVAAGVGGLAAAGLATVSPGAESVNLLGPGGAASVLAGALAGAAVPWALIQVETRLRIDDVAGLGAASLVGGTVGLVVSSVTRHTNGAATYFGGLLRDAVFGLLAMAVVGGSAFLIARVFATRGAIRVGETAEYDGLDLTELDVNAYPDFQQTMIKSHHLRQL